MASRTEGGKLRVLPLDRSGRREEVHILGIRARPAALDVSEAKLVQPPSDLYLCRKRDEQAFTLGAVTQGRGVENYSVAHRGPTCERGCSAATTASPIS